VYAQWSPGPSHWRDDLSGWWPAGAELRHARAGIGAKRAV